MITCPKCQSDYIGVEAVIKGIGFVNVNNRVTIYQPEEFDTSESDLSGPKLTCFDCNHEWEVQS